MAASRLAGFKSRVLSIPQSDWNTVSRYTRRTRRLIWAAGLSAAGVALASCSSSPAPGAGGSQSPGSSTGGTPLAARPGDITPLCPDKPTKVEYIKSQGGDVYSVIAGNEFMYDAKKCPTIQASWLDVTGGEAAAIAATNAAVAQGVKVLVVQPDFGPSQLPSMRKAVRAGVTVISVLAETDGIKGTDFTDQVVWSDTSIADKQAQWLGTHVKKGNLAWLGGAPGVASSTALFAAFKAAVAKYAPGISILTGNWIPTNWSAGTKRQTVAALIAKYHDIAVVASDYAATDVGALQGIKDAGAPMPAFVNIASSQAFVCEAEKDHAAWFGQDGTTGMAAVALRVGLADSEHATSPEKLPYPLFVYADTVDGKKPACVPGISPDADLSSSLPLSTLESILK
jgi:ribose transport system substrate-binding protein